MKTLKLIFSLVMAIAFNYQANAQSEVLNKLTDQKSYWQISARGGYDFPLFKEDFQYIDYKGGLMGGLSVNHYWKWIGVQADFDYIQNKPVTNIESPTTYFTNGPTGISTYALDVTTQTFITKEDIERLKGTKYYDFVLTSTEVVREYGLVQYGVSRASLHDPLTIGYLLDPSFLKT